MKRIFTIIVLGAVISFAGCADLDDIYRELDDLKKRNKEQADRLNDHEARLKALEGLVRTANSEITTLKGLVNAVEKRVSVVSYKELADMSGYELIMSDGTTINLKHGKASVVGTKVHTDGLLYWTLNGEFMRDALGKMICAQGKEGVTPTLRVNTAGHWEVSFDGATTWQEVKDSNGYPVKAIGEDGAHTERHLTPLHYRNRYHYCCHLHGANIFHAQVERLLVCNGFEQPAQLRCRVQRELFGRRFRDEPDRL